MTVRRDRGYDSGLTRARLAGRGLCGEIVERGKPAPVTAGKRRVVERTTTWCTERRAAVVTFWIT